MEGADDVHSWHDEALIMNITWLIFIQKLSIVLKMTDYFFNINILYSILIVIL